MLEKYSKEEIKKNYITKKAAAELLGTTERTINNYITNGNLDILNIGKTTYIKKDDLEKYLDEFYKRNNK